MKSLVLTQPMFLPWPGMFEQAMLADIFIFHDNIPLPRSHGKNKAFQTRVQIKTASGWEWLTLPVASGQSSTLLIKDARFPDQNWRRMHLAAIKRNYKQAPFFEQVWNELIVPIYEFQTDFVAEFCTYGMTRLFEHLGIRVPVYWTSNLPIRDELVASPRVLAHCLYFNAEVYISALGALKYINYDLFEENGVRIHFMKYALTPYPQIHGDFNPFVSIIDLLFNTGPDCKQYLGSTSLYWREMDVEVESRRVK